MQNHTHDVTVGPKLVRKKYVNWADGEPEREWLCLSLLARHASGVAPHPIRFTHEGDAPVVVMERLPGNPLRNAPASADQIAALGRALRRIYAVPMEAIEVSGLRERKVGPTEIANVLLSALNVPRDLSKCHDPQLVSQALDLARTHLRSRGTVPTLSPTVRCGKRPTCWNECDRCSTRWPTNTPTSSSRAQVDGRSAVRWAYRA